MFYGILIDMNVFNDNIIEMIKSNVFNGKMNVFKGYIN